MRTGYFEEMYAAAADPWGFESRWYEQRKYALTLAALPRPRYRRAYEPGCSIGVLSARLAERCDELLCTDLVPAAVDQAAARLAGAAAVEVRRGDLREGWPDGEFDLVVLSELLYYLSEPEVTETLAALPAHLTADAHVVAVHWRHPVPDYPLTGDRADELVREALGPNVLGAYRDEDLVLTVLGRPGACSVAAESGLLDDPELPDEADSPDDREVRDDHGGQRG